MSNQEWKLDDNGEVVETFGNMMNVLSKFPRRGAKQPVEESPKPKSMTFGELRDIIQFLDGTVPDDMEIKIGYEDYEYGWIITSAVGYMLTDNHVLIFDEDFAFNLSIEKEIKKCLD